MSVVRYISDLHLNHRNMAIHRGFADEIEMNEHIISSWNSVVGKKDTVWILGDITMEKSSGYELLDRLNGYKKVVLGNHDQPQHIPELLKYVNKVCGVFEYDGYIMTHVAIHESEIHHFRGNIHGHNHDSRIDHPKYYNVACEQIGYKPKTIDELIKIYDRN